MQPKKAVTAVLVIVLAGLCILMSMTGLFYFRKGFFPLFFTFGGKENQSNAIVSSDEHKVIPVDSPLKLTVENPFGNVRLTGYSGDEISLDIVKRAWGYDPQKARESLDKIQVEIVQDSESIKIKVVPPENSISITTSVDFTISVPMETAVEITLNNGDIDLKHLEAETVLHSDFGDIDVADQKKGGLKASSKNGVISALQIQSGNMPVVLSSDFGNVKLIEGSSGSVEIRSKNGMLTLENVNSSGSVSLSSDFGSISFIQGRSGKFDATSRNGDVKISSASIDGSLTVQTDFGDINLDNAIAGAYDLQNKNGTIFVNTASGHIEAKSDFGDISVLNGQLCNLSLTTQNGDIDFSGSLDSGPHSLTTKFGDISLGLPPDSAIDINAQTAFGDINNSFRISITGDLKENHLTGEINGGGTPLTLKTSNGTITLKSIPLKEQ